MGTSKTDMITTAGNSSLNASGLTGSGDDLTP